VREPLTRILLTLALAAVVSVWPSAKRRPAESIADLVEIDAVVVDGKGKPVHGLQKTDFSVRENGKPVTITTFREVTEPKEIDADAARTLTLLLDDTGVAPLGTQTVQIIAKAFLESASLVDDVSVVRLHARDDEAFGDRLTAASRILGYRAGAYPFVVWSTSGDVLARIRDITRAVSSGASRSKVIVCIGSPFICNVREPDPSAPRSFENLWVDTVAEAAAANVAMYAIVPGRAPLRGGGLPDMTGGEVFTPNSDLGPAIDRILRDASNHYVLGYWPADSTPRKLHRVEVKTSRRGARLHARRLR